jgi:hypothetical protein
MTIQQKQKDLKPKAQAVWAALERLTPPVGWSPAGPDDPYILKAFSEGWPQELQPEG